MFTARKETGKDLKELVMKNHIGFIGLGNMGMGMARNILKAGSPSQPMTSVKSLCGK